jgi:hypothetical protein
MWGGVLVAPPHFVFIVHSVDPLANGCTASESE